MMMVFLFDLLVMIYWQLLSDAYFSVDLKSNRGIDIIIIQ